MKTQVLAPVLGTGLGLAMAMAMAAPLVACGHDDAGAADAGDDGGVTADGAADGASPDAEPGPDAWTPPPCPTFGAGQVRGTLGSAAVTEASGVVESRAQPGVLWVHNDSGDTARLFAMTADGSHLGAYSLAGVTAVDWEDVAIDDTYLYAGDFGDNFTQRPFVTVYRVAEPTVAVDQAPVTQQLTGVDPLELQYPDTAHNAETLLVDPVDGDLYIITKASSGDSRVFRAPAPLDPSSRVTLEEVAALALGGAARPGDTHATGGDTHPAGTALLVRTYNSAFFWWRPPGAPLWEAFSHAPCPAPLRSEPQGEAIGFSADGQGYYTVSEGDHPPLYHFTLTWD